ncbi:MAG: MmyB family transcriptional regulator, partial [Humibacter sp.]
FFADWNTKAFEVVGQLRLDAGMHGDDPLLASLIGELSMASADFRRLWAAHDVKRQSYGELEIRHDLVGELTLQYETLLLPDDQEQALTVYHADPGAALESLRLIVSGASDAQRPQAPPSESGTPG